MNHIKGYKSTFSAELLHARKVAEAQMVLEHDKNQYTSLGWRYKWFLYARKVEMWGQCHNAALWCAWGALEGGACPNMLSMLVE